MPTLYEISDELAALEAVLQEHGGDLDVPECAAAWAEYERILTTDLYGKADGYCSLILELDARAHARRKEADRLTATAITDERAAKALKGRLLAVMEARGMKKLDGTKFRASICGNGGLQPLELTGPVPDGFLVHPPPEPDNQLIRDSLAGGAPLDFARLLPRGNHVRIR